MAPLLAGLCLQGALFFLQGVGASAAVGGSSPKSTCPPSLLLQRLLNAASYRFKRGHGRCSFLPFLPRSSAGRARVVPDLWSPLSPTPSTSHARGHHSLTQSLGPHTDRTGLPASHIVALGTPTRDPGWCARCCTNPQQRDSPCSLLNLPLFDSSVSPFPCPRPLLSSPS